ncbi:DUF4202 domain-containing protein [Thalassomonas sp. M1454]|uniref:DUF4202 domain-containing protein n=1 Tax=Thalassomonas sp. M1454 TaxID=2594477 RepID=UPI00117E4D34|nr:DUF4202 domain-containing protein [Thalassomonas sp. M1454]TRX53149.1 DUF4202 domain-containing protein [Thalassomonas sp. M1454]
MTIDKLTHSFKLIDKANSEDPNVELCQGEEYPKELLYSLRMTNTLNSFYPEAGQALQVAARCQHICRWQIPRNSYEMNRAGYLTWRRELNKFHANKAAEILPHLENDVINEVQRLILKADIKKDADSQTLEDVVCLVFLEFYFADFAAKHTDEKVIRILQKTWRKMSEKAHAAALKLNFDEGSKTLITTALS